MIKFMIKKFNNIEKVVVDIDGMKLSPYKIGDNIIRIANFDIDKYFKMYDVLISKARNQSIENIENEYIKLKKVLIHLHPYFNIITYEMIQNVVINRALTSLLKEHISLRRLNGEISITSKCIDMITYEDFRNLLTSLCIDFSIIDTSVLYKSFIEPSSESLLFLQYIDDNICFNLQNDTIDISFIHALVKEWSEWILDSSSPFFENSLSDSLDKYFNLSLYELNRTEFSYFKPSIKSRISKTGMEKYQAKRENPIVSDGEISVSNYVVDTQVQSDINEIESHTIYLAETIYGLLYAELLKMTRSNKVVKKCESCGKYFIVDYGSIYCSSCKKNNLGAHKKYSEKIRKNPILSEYKKEYNRRRAEVERGKRSIVDFTKWADAMKVHLLEVSNGKVSYDDFLVLLKM